MQAAGQTSNMAESFVGFHELARNDPNLGQKSSVFLRYLQPNDEHYGGIDNLIAVWQSNDTVDHLCVIFDGYDTPTQEDNERLIQPILEHLIRSRTQLRKLSLWDARTPALLQLILQFMEAATQNVLIEELSFYSIINLTVDHFARLFRTNSQ